MNGSGILCLDLLIASWMQASLQGENVTHQDLGLPQIVPDTVLLILLLIAIVCFDRLLCDTCVNRPVSDFDPDHKHSLIQLIHTPPFVWSAITLAFALGPQDNPSFPLPPLVLESHQNAPMKNKFKETHDLDPAARSV